MIQIGTPVVTIDAPIEHIMACHRRIEQRLDSFVRAGSCLEGDFGSALEAIRTCCQFLVTSGAMHTADEEQSLFLRMRPLLSPSEADFVNSLEAEHREVELIYEDLKQLVGRMHTEFTMDLGRQFVDLAERLRSRYRKHIQAEDQTLIALVTRSLGADQIAQIAREMRVRRA